MLISMAIAAILTLLGPVALAWWFVRRFGARPRWILFGALAFIGAQVIHLPLYYAFIGGLQSGRFSLGDGLPGSLLLALILGGMAGLFEGVGRWLSIKALKAERHTWKAPLAVGIGHGGIESMLIVGLSLTSTVVVFTLLRLNPQAFGIALDPTGEIQASMGNILSAPWYDGLAGAVERITTVIFHITLTMLVWLGIERGRAWLFWIAVGYHTLLDSMVVFLSRAGVGTWQLEGILALAAAFNLWLLWRILNPLRQAEAQAQPGEPT